MNDLGHHIRVFAPILLTDIVFVSGLIRLRSPRDIFDYALLVCFSIVFVATFYRQLKRQRRRLHHE